MELRDYIRIIRKEWIWIVILALVGLGTGSAYTFVKSPSYSATSIVFVSTQADGGSAADLLQGNTYTQDRVTSYANLVQTPAVLLPVITALGLSSTPGALAKNVSATSPLNTTLIDITAKAGSARLSADLANAAATSLSTVVQQLETTAADDGVSPVKLTRVQAAAVPERPASPRKTLDAVLGLLIGVLVGLALAFLKEALDQRVRGEHDVATITQSPVVGGILFDSKASQRPLIVHDEPFDVRSEAFRVLRTNLQFLEVDEAKGRSFVVTSSLPQEGKSTTVANLGLALADASNRVLLVEADLRRPKLVGYLGLDGGVGLTDVIVGNAKLDDVVLQWGETSLYVLPAGSLPPNPSELLGSAKMAELIAKLDVDYDYVLYDASPLLPVTDASIISRHVSGAIVVAAVTKTHRGQLRAAISSLEQVGTKISGVVMTMVPIKNGSYSYGRYSYGYYGQSASGGYAPTERPDSVALK